MRRTLLHSAPALLVAIAASATMHAASSAVAACEGTVAYSNGSASAVTNALTMTRVPAGRTFLAALYYLPDTGAVPADADFDQGTVLGPAVGFVVPGVFIGGTRSAPATEGGGFAWFQVRVWESAFGTNVFASYEEALATQATVGGRLPLLGRSGILKAQTGNPCAIPPTVPGSVATQGFYVGTDLVADRIPPTLNCPTNIEASMPVNQGSQVVNFTVTAVDELDPAPSVTCIPASGSIFPRGTTTVNCAAQDFSGNRNQCSFTVTVNILGDHTPPAITCPADVTVTMVTGQVSRVVSFSVAALDDLDPAPVVTCSPASGSAFPPGSNAVNCVARDWNGNSSQCRFSVTVNVEPDTTPPTMQCPTNMAVGIYAWQITRRVEFTATATDAVDAAPVVTCQPPSGSIFLLGETNVTCTARDFSGNASQCSFTVTVRVTEDHTPPVLTCSNVRVYAFGQSQVVNFTPGVTDDLDPSPVVTCQPPSGSTLPLGDTFVICTARDLGSNTSSCSFTVTVTLAGGSCGGTVSFANGSQGLITNVLTGNPLPVGRSFLVGFYYLPDRPTTPTETDFDQGAVLLPAVGISPAPGRFNSGVRSTPCSTIPGGDAWFQVRVWESVFGASVFTSYEEARDTRTPVGGRFPLLTVFSPMKITTGNPTTSPPGTPTGVGVPGSLVTNRPVCVTPPPGLVAWWTGDGNVTDLAGGNPGTLSGATFGPSQVGRAFRFDAPRTGVALSNIANLRLQDFTIEAWIRRASTSQVTLDVYENAALFACTWGGYGFAIADDGRLFLTKIGYSAVFSHLVITDTNFHHVAVTKTGTDVVIYLDGIGEVVGPYDAVFEFNGPAAIGARGGDLANTFWGSIDEVSVYSRTLSDAEVQTLAGAAAGKCVVSLPPALAAEPQSQTTCPGYSATFAVVAAGSPPLGFSWWFEDVPLAGATDSIFHLDSVGTNMAGRYRVVVTNAAGAITSAVAVLTVDARPPMVTLNGGAAMTFECPANFLDPGATAQDACGGTLPVDVIGAVDSGTAGLFTLAYTARDGAGQAGSATRTVIIADTIPPVLDCPPDLSTEFTSVTGAVVAFPVPASSDLCAGPVVVRCVPESGSQFPIGTTPVVCAATDASGNTTVCGFTVTVHGARGAGLQMQEGLQALLAETTEPRAERRLNQAIASLAEALDSKYWVDETHVKARDGRRVFDGLKRTATTLEGLLSDRRSQVPDAQLRPLMERLAQVARLLAWVALQDASDSDSGRLTLLWQEVDRGDMAAAHGEYDKAIQRYWSAWLRSAHLVLRLTPHPAAGKVRLELQAIPGEVYAIEASTNLLDWVTIGTCAAGPDGVVGVEDPAPGQVRSRFFRAKSP